MVMTDGAKMGFLRHRKSIKLISRPGGEVFFGGRGQSPSPSLIDLMSFGWLFLGGLLPSRARLRFTSFADCVTVRAVGSNYPPNPKTFRIDFYVRQRIQFHLDFYVRQHGRSVHQSNRS